MDANLWQRLFGTLAMIVGLVGVTDAVRRGDHSEARQWLTIDLLGLLVVMHS